MEEITLKDRFAIARTISNAPKSKVLMIVKLFEPVIGMDLTPYYRDTDILAKADESNKIIEAIKEFVSEYENAVIKTKDDGTMALNVNALKNFLETRKINYRQTTKLLAELGLIEESKEKHRTFPVYANGKSQKCVLLKPEFFEESEG